MLWLGESSAALNKTYSLDEVIKEVSKVRREDVREVGRRIFKDSNLNLALIGPIKNNEDGIYSQLEL
jgi:predicted Zn-dependent peptidase